MAAAGDEFRSFGTGVFAGVSSGNATGARGGDFFLKKLNIDFAYRVMHSIKRPNASPLPTIFSSVTPCFAGLTLLLVITGAPARAQVPGGVEQFTLANGLTVIPKPDPRAPTLAQMLWERVGSIDEVNGTSGVAHAREHMMFKGTAMLKPGEFSRRVAASGGGVKTPSPAAITRVITSRFPPTSLKT